MGKDGSRDCATVAGTSTAAAAGNAAGAHYEMQARLKACTVSRALRPRAGDGSAAPKR